MGFDISSQEQAIGTIQREYLYIFSVESLPSGLGDKASAWSNFQSNVDFYNQKAVWPEKATAPIKLQWGGQFMNFSGVEQSEKEADFIFYDDEKGNVYSFLSSCQALTGDDAAHAAAADPSQRFTVMISDVNTQKSVVTKARVLSGFKVMKVKKTQPNKEGQGFSLITAHCTWTMAYDNNAAAGKAVSEAASELQNYLSGMYELTEKKKEA